MGIFPLRRCSCGVLKFFTPLSFQEAEERRNEMMKKWIASLLAAVMLLSLMTTALAVTPSFSDIPDAATRQEVDILRMMGIVSGDDKGNFNPTGTLTRAQFCKMAIEAMGRGDEETLYRTRTLFPDVRSTHWARGYINMAATMTIGGSTSEDGSNTSGTKLIRGMSDGTFQPDRAITYAEAVTILMRTLGYDDTSVGMLWPDGYLNLAGEIGLTSGLTLKSGDSLTRAQAAHLFCNLLNSKTKSGSRYVNTLGSAKENVIILALDVKGNDGEEGAIRTSDGVYHVASGVVPSSLQGRRGTLILNEKDQIITFFADAAEQKAVVVSKAQATWLVGEDGIRYNIPAEATIYTDTENTTYDKVWVDLAPGTQVTLFLTSGGKVDSMYANLALAEEAIVVTKSVSDHAFDSITGGARNMKYYRDNYPSALTEIRKYDVITYDAESNILHATSQHVTGMYENASPNPEAPRTVTVLGRQFPVMASATEALASFKIGQEITLLLTQDGQVAGAVSPKDLRASVIGLVDEISSTSVKVTLLNGMKLESVPNPEQKDLEVSELKGALVSITSTELGTVNLTKITGRNLKEPFNVKNMTMGEYRVVDGVALYERVGTSVLTSISLEDLTLEKIPTGKIAYVHRNSNDDVDIIILRDVTGDQYAYGFYSYDDGRGGMDDEEGDNSDLDDDGFFLPEGTVTIRNSGKHNTVDTLYTSDTYRDGAAGGLVASRDGTVAASVDLKMLKNISRHDFFTKDGITYVTVNNVTYPVSKEVECYNRPAKVWFDSLTEARAFSDNLTLYYDRSPEEGGKIRLVVAN